MDALARSGAEAVLTTPAHQSPTGVVLSAARRTALVEWARAGHLIIEDDYDAEYRYDRAPVGSLQGIAPDRVVYVGSTSKTLAPGLRIGWMVLPPHLAKAVALSKGLADTGSSVMDQVAFAQFLASGEYDRHLRQMRRRYQARRNALLRALARHLPEATVLGAAAGVHLTVRFPDGFPLEDLVTHAARKRIRVEPLAPCYAEPATAPPGLLLGYANLTESQIEQGCAGTGSGAGLTPATSTSAAASASTTSAATATGTTTTATVGADVARARGTARSGRPPIAALLGPHRLSVAWAMQVHLASAVSSLGRAAVGRCGYSTAATPPRPQKSGPAPRHRSRPPPLRSWTKTTAAFVARPVWNRYGIVKVSAQPDTADWSFSPYA